jgi:hypothetical protein
MTTQDKIAKEIKDKFRNYAGRMHEPFITLHARMRITMGDEKFLEYLEQIPPRPIFDPLKTES